MSHEDPVDEVDAELGGGGGEEDVDDDLEEDDEADQAEVDEDEEDEEEPAYDDDEEDIKIDNTARIEVGDLDKIKRNALKKRYTNFPQISKTMLKMYKNAEVVSRSEYAFLSNDDLRNDAEEYIGELEDHLSEYIERKEGDTIDYTNTLYQLFSALHSSDNKNVISKKLDTDIRIKDICMPEEMEQNEIDCRYLVERPDPVESDEVCKKCGCNKIFSIRKQTRGGDEGQTTFNYCTNCPNNWKC